MFDALKTLIGDIPTGYDGVVYVMCIPVLMWLLSQFFGILRTILGVLSDA